MKGLAIQLIGSRAALIVMAGAVGVHWWKLESENRVSTEAGWHAISTPSGSDPGMVPVSTTGTPLEHRSQGAPGATGPRVEVETATVQALQEVVAVLQAIKAENNDLRDQLKEANRTMNGLQIQIDGYDDDFRPLKLAPTSEGIIDSGNPLLPPKKW